MKILRLVFVIVVQLSSFCFGNEHEKQLWSSLPDFPDPVGRAGVYAGIHHDCLVIAGGANFTEPVWQSDKVYHDDIYLFSKTDSQWRKAGTLAHRLGYGASVSTKFGIVCIGGHNEQTTFSEVVLLHVNPKTLTVDQKPLPNLPMPCTTSSATKIGNTLFVAGGTSTNSLDTAMKNFWSLDLDSMDQPNDFKWRILPAWPGPPRAFNIAVAQHDGKGDRVYVMSGRTLTKDQSGNAVLVFLDDMYAYTPLSDEPWTICQSLPRCAMAAPGINIGQSHIYIFGGADGSLFNIADQLKEKHPGFKKDILAYHTITNTWSIAGQMPEAPVTTVALRWGDDPFKDPVIITSGELKPRVRTPKIWSISPKITPTRFSWIDFSVIGIYLIGIILVSLFFSFKNKTTDDYFRGGQRIPWFVAGCSIFATMLSSITFIAIPAKAFATDWVFITVNITAVLLTPFVIGLFLPFFRNIDATSAYEYLEKRFNRLIRLFASASFCLFQIGRMAVVMYLPALALATITPLTEIQCILIMSLLSMMYCTLGGLEAVVWTDTLQTIVLLSGALLSFFVLIHHIDGGMQGFWNGAIQDHKFKVIQWDFSSSSFSSAALWVIFLGGLGQNLVPYTSDMSIIQRYMSVPDSLSAKKAIWVNAIMILPTSILFYAIGTALYVFYQQHPLELDASMKNDAIFPLFIASHLPVGIAGLVVAGIFSAAQSTVSTSMNSTATAIVTDFIRPLQIVKNDSSYLMIARICTILLGLAGTSLAILFSNSDIKSLLDQFMKILGLLGAPMCGLFCLGIFTNRTNSKGAMSGAITSSILLFLIQKTDVHFMLYSVIGIVVCIFVGYTSSFAFSSMKTDLKGLTLYE